MLNNVLNSTSTGLLQKLAEFGERRHAVLSKNLAHIETPNYKTRDLPVAAFENALAAAVRAQGGAVQGGNSSVPTPSVVTPTASSVSSWMAGSLPNATPSTTVSMESLFPQELFQEVESDPKNVTFQDGGNRSVEREFMELRKNLMLQQFAVQLMTSQFAMMQTVISERA